MAETTGDHLIDRVDDGTALSPKRAHVLRSPAGRCGGATFFAHAPGFDGELTLLPSDGWTVLRRPG